MGQTEKKLKILLVKPDISHISVGFTSLARVAPLDLMMVAASVPQHVCRILDLRLEKSKRALEAELAAFRPDVVGVTAYSAESQEAKDICRRVKAVLPEAVTVIGGYHATMATEDVLREPAVDFVVRGEGEETFPELLAAWQRGEGLERVRGIAYRREGSPFYTPPRPQIPNLDWLPFPDWGLVSRYQSRYYLNVMGVMASVETTRGCPFDCNFCSVWVFNRRRYRKKSPSRVLKELKRLPQEIDVIAFVDDEFWADARRALEIADLILAEPEESPLRHRRYWAQVRTNDIVRHPELVERWARAGLKVLLLGIESHKDAELEELHHKRNKVQTAIEALKIMRRHGVEAWGCFIVNPEWGEGDFEELIRFVRQNEIAFPQFTVLTPLPGTVLTERLIREGTLDLNQLPFQLLDFLHSAIKTSLPLRRFYELLARLYRETSMASNLNLYKRAVRNGVLNRAWLKSPMGRQVTGFLSQLTNVEAYLKAHRLLGQEV